MEVQRIGVLVIVGLIGLAGCGDDDTTTVINQPAGATTAAEDPDELDAFLREADQLCQDFNRQARDAEQAADSFPDVVSRVDEIIDQGMDDLAELTVPEEIAVQWRQYLAAVEDQQAALARASDEARAGDTSAARSSYEEALRVRDRKSDIALEIGLAECGAG